MIRLSHCLLFTGFIFLSACNNDSNNDDPNTPASDAISNNALDSDGDGLTDSLELQLDLDPFKEDSDGDGTNDGLDQIPAAIVCEADGSTGADAGPVDDGAVAENPDADADGLTDQREAELGTDPMNVDTDADGVIDGDDDFPTDPTETNDDNGDGLGDNANPIIIDTDADGLTDQREAELGTDPMNVDTDADGVIDGDDDFPTDPTETNDDNGDGLGDNANPILIDTDADGLSDERELELGLNPNNADTDADGFSDSEDRFPNDPLANADSDDDGVPDSRDAFPNDATETTDLNGDGLGDNANPIDGTVISGTVADIVSGASIAEAQVSLDLVNTGSQNDAVVQASTDASGSFALVAPNNLLPDSFVLVVTTDGYRPEVVAYNNNSETEINAEIELTGESADFTSIEANPNIHHLGDDSFTGSANSQFQRSAEGITLLRNFNVTASQASSTEIMLDWVAKGIQKENAVVINGQLLATTPETNTDGSFSDQSIVLAVEGILVEGSNTIEITSELDASLNDYDDFEFVLVGLTGLN